MLQIMFNVSLCSLMAFKKYKKNLISFNKNPNLHFLNLQIYGYWFSANRKISDKLRRRNDTMINFEKYRIFIVFIGTKFLEVWPQKVEELL